MSYNLVDPTTGDLTRVAGNIDTSIIPSDASASNKLATTNSTLKTIQLSGSVDCNTLTEPGLYTASAGAVVSITNTPADIGSVVQLDGGFSILVTKTNVDGVYYGMQMFIPYGSDSPFIRKSYYLNGQYWTDWEQLATMDKLNYSTTETPIGTWVDGKTIYRTYVSFPAFELKPYEWNTVNSLSITGIHEVINARAKRSEDNAVIPLAARSAGTSIELNPSANFGISKLILEYTKQ